MVVWQTVLLLCDCFAVGLLTVGSGQELTIDRSESFNHHGGYVAANAHDGDYNTQYSVKDYAVAGNFLKLYLSQQYNIGEVNMTVRKDCCKERIVNTEVFVYSTLQGEQKVLSCGKITKMKTEKFPDDPEKDIEARTYSLDCDGAVGDMVYLTDTDYNLNAGHNFVEVKIYGFDVCPAGTYRTEGMEACDPCIDSTVSAAGSTECSACQEGSQANTEKTECDLCQQGTYRSSGMVKCADCDAGKIPNSDKSACDTCKAGMYRTQSMLTCESCPVGSQANTAKTQCEPCVDGQYRSLDMTKCNTCEDGVVPNSDKSACELFCEGPTIANSQIEGKVTAGAWIKIRCQAGFAVIGQEIITCQANGDYSDKPTCEKIGTILLNPLVKSTG